MTLLADIIIPVYNERDNLPPLLVRLRALPDFLSYNLIFVDNASCDGSAELIESISGVTLIRHESNRGYGASLRSGIAAAQTEQLVIIDADGEYPPECISYLLTELAEYPVVYASRLLGKKSAQQAGMSLLKWKGNRMISAAYNFLFAQRVTDLYTGCKALRRSCLANVTLQRDGFEQVLEMSAKLSAHGYSITEIAVDFVPRSFGKSKMLHVSETVKYFFWLLFYRVKLSPILYSSAQEVLRDK
jgi:glycosyltransferase involved in cell wall biosynthesis